MRKYEFSWDLIGDVAEGREHLGTEMDVEVYRLMQFTLRDVLEERLGAEAVDEVFYEAGRLAGKAFFQNLIAPVETLDEFVNKTQQLLRDKKIGILRVETVEDEQVVLTIDEDLDCSGLPILDYETCVYDEGFVGALFEEFTGRSWRATEVDCWCTGARTCRFRVIMTDGAENDA